MGKANQNFESSESEEFENSAAEELLADAREYYATAFSNPERQNCPARRELISPLESNRLPDENLRRHLLSCSECFRDFHAARQAQSRTEKAAAISNRAEKSWLSFLFNPLPIAATVAGLLLVATIVFFAWRKTNEKVAVGNQTAPILTSQPVEKDLPNQNANNSEIGFSQTENNSQPNQNANQTNTKTSANKIREQNPNPNAAKLIAQNTIRFDVKPQEVWRAEQNGGRKNEIVKTFKAMATVLQLNLPPEYPSGVYEVSFYDETGNKITAQTATRRKSEKLEVKFDLRPFSGRRLRLCIAPNGEVPDCYPVKIGKAK